MKTNEYAARDILARVLAVLQEAEELGAPDGVAYVELMEAVAKEATTRLATYAWTLVHDVRNGN